MYKSYGAGCLFTEHQLMKHSYEDYTFKGMHENALASFSDMKSKNTHLAIGAKQMPKVWISLISKIYSE